MTTRELPSGVLVLDKPRGPTSHDVVARVRRALRTRHVGHAGTLDPMATGVLVIAVGEATKLVPWLTADDKTYEATVTLGVETDTLDAEGVEVRRAPVPAELALDAALAHERARVMQVPPIYSAIRIDGRRAHELARAGVATVMAARPVAVRTLDIIERRGDALVVRVEAAKGYFVRSLGRDLAEALGTVGHLSALRRVRSGSFVIGDAATEVTEGALLSVSAAATRALPVTVLDDAGARAVSFGQTVRPEQMRDPHRAPSAWVDDAGQLLAIGQCHDDGTGRMIRGFSISSRSSPSRS